MENKLRDFKPAKQTYDNIYRGRVCDNNDPMKLGRVKVEVYPMFKGMSVDSLYWAEVIQGQSATMSIPPINSWVFVQFELGDYRKPLVIGSALPMNGTQGTCQANANAHQNPKLWTQESLTTYPNTIITRTPQKILSYIDDYKKEIALKLPGGTKVIITDNSEIQIQIKHHTGSNVEINTLGDIRIQRNTGDIIELTDGNIEVTNKVGSTVKLSPDATEVVDFSGSRLELKDSSVTLKNVTGNSMQITPLGILFEVAGGTRLHLESDGITVQSAGDLRLLSRGAQESSGTTFFMTDSGGGVSTSSVITKGEAPEAPEQPEAEQGWCTDDRNME